MPPSILVSRTAYEQQVLGFDFSTSLGEIATLRGEAAYRRPYNWAVPADHHIAFPDVQYTVGADHTFGSLSIIVQYMGRYVFDWQKLSGPMMVLDPSVLPMEPMSSLKSVSDIVTSTLAKQNQILFSQTAQLQHLATLRFEWLGAARDAVALVALPLQLHHARVAGHAPDRLPSVRRDHHVCRRAGLPRADRHAVRHHRRPALRRLRRAALHLLTTNEDVTMHTRRFAVRHARLAAVAGRRRPATRAPRPARSWTR